MAGDAFYEIEKLKIGLEGIDKEKSSCYNVKKRTSRYTLRDYGRIEQEVGWSVLQVYFQ